MRRIIAVVLFIVSAMVISACSSAPSNNAVDTVSNASVSSATMADSQTNAAASASSSSASLNDESSLSYPLIEYIDNDELSGGYTCTWTLKIGQWVKASDSEKLEAAWKAVGGKRGECPKASDFSTPGCDYKENTTLLAFGCISIKDTTQGGFRLSDSSKAITKNLGCPDIKLYLCGKLYFSDKEQTERQDPLKMEISPKITGTTWGPVPVVLCLGESISPEYPDGDPSKFEAQWYFGSNSFKILPTWASQIDIANAQNLADFCGDWAGESGSSITFYNDGTACVSMVEGVLAKLDGVWEIDDGNNLHLDFSSTYLGSCVIPLESGFDSTSIYIDFDNPKWDPERFVKK